MDRLVGRHPGVQAGQFGVPDGAGVVDFAHCDDAAGLDHPAELAQDLHRLGEVLENLVDMHDVEAVVVELEIVGVADDELDVGPAPAEGRCLLDDRRGGVEADDRTRREAIGEVDGDGAGSAPDVEQAQPGSEMRDEVGRRILHRPPGVRPDDARVMPVGVPLVG